VRKDQIKMRRKFTVVAVVLVALSSSSLVTGSPASAAVKAGSSCKKIGKTVVRSGTELTCKKRKGRKVWTVTKSSAPSATSSGPNLNVLGVHPNKKLACLSGTFNSFIDVFGIYVVSTPKVPKKYLQHTANVLAQYLDNDADGKPDDQKVATYIADNGYIFPVWTPSAREKFWEQASGTPCEDNVQMAASMYYLEDQWAFGTATDADEEAWSLEFDGNLEEVWHLVSVGFYNVYPKDFSDKPSASTLTRAMDKARGGKFMDPPSRYPSKAWYTNEEGPYEVQAHEYIYWALMSNMGVLSSIPGMCQGVQHEWKICTKEDLKAGDIQVYNLLNQKGYAIPTRIPDGNYKS